MTTNYAKWFIELKKIKKNSFQEISKDFMKNDFELMILICLFTKKEVSIYFQLMIWFNFICINFQKKLFLLIVYKKNYYKILIWQQKLLYFLSLENNEFLQFYLQKYFDSFSFKKKSDFYKLFKMT